MNATEDKSPEEEKIETPKEQRARLKKEKKEARRAKMMQPNEQAAPEKTQEGKE